ncbi:DUF397 domain-containing protein [Spirillospora sp. CA-108201]
MIVTIYKGIALSSFTGSSGTLFTSGAKGIIEGTCMTQHVWRKSSYSEAQDSCVEVAPTKDGVAVRDSKSQAVTVVIPGVLFRRLLNALKSGHLDV